jgi:N-acetylmuramoyl-L-alanine amidase
MREALPENIWRFLNTLAVVCGLLSGAAGFFIQNVFAQQVPARDNALVVGTDVQITSESDRVRLSVALSAPVAVDAYSLTGPDRIVVDLPEINFQIAAGIGKKARGFVPGFRFGLMAPGRSRIVIDLSEPAEIVSAQVTEKRGGFGELVIELRRTDRAAFTTSASRPERLQAKTSVPAPVSSPERPAIAGRLPVVVIDPGHGGIDPGASGAAVSEKAIVLAFGLALRDRLMESGRYKVVMTRDDDRFVSLGDRVSAARTAGAELFISVHADSMTQALDVRGATIYTGSDRATDAESARLAAKENAVDAAAGLEQREDTEEVAGILMELARRETKTFSSSFAKTLVSRLGPSIRLHRIPLRSAGFRVLGAPDIPSVLIELGYVTSSRDAELLTSDAWRRGAAHSVALAVDDFFKSRRSALLDASVSP